MRRENNWEKSPDSLWTAFTGSRQGRAALFGLVILLSYQVWNWWQHSPQSAPPPGNSTTPTSVVRIATWNLRFFSTHRKDIPEPDFRAIAQVIRSSNFDVVAIQEVKGQGEAVDALLNSLGQPYRSTSLSPETGNGERFTFIFNGQHVQDLNHSHPIDLPESTFAFQRHPYQASFQSGHFNFTLVTCHIFYGEKAEGHARRGREVQELAQYAQGLETREKDVIVLGDFNEQHAVPFVHYFMDEGWQDLITARTNLEGTKIAETFDHIFIDPKKIAAWDGQSGSIPWDIALYHDDTGDESQRRAADKQAEDNVSDHRPAYADFRTE